MEIVGQKNRLDTKTVLCMKVNFMTFSFNLHMEYPQPQNWIGLLVYKCCYMFCIVCVFVDIKLWTEDYGTKF